MNKSSVYYWLLSLFAAMLLSLTAIQQVQASSTNDLYWGEVQTAEYAPLHAYTLNWTGDVLDRGGMNLSTLTQTTNSSEADIVINQYGAFGARTVVKLSSHSLEEQTAGLQSGSLSSITMTQGDIYLITLSSGQYAKVRIDSIQADKVAFSYVIEAEHPETPQPSATPKPSTAPQPSAEPQPNSASTTITLTIGNKQATINGQSTALQTSPVVRNNTTLVPLRFIATSMGAEVDWDAATQKITLQLHGKTIILYINSKMATINGKSTTLLTAPIIENSATLVPLRFITENFNMDVNYNQAMQKITITGKAASSQSTGNTNGPDANDEPNINEDFSKYYGGWNLWIEGGAFNIYNPATGEYISHRYSAGEEGGTLTINANGSYTLKTYLVTQNGRWRAAGYNEVFGYNGAIILEAGDGKEAWAMYETPSGKIALAQDSGGKYTDGSVIWIIQFILNKGK